MYEPEAEEALGKWSSSKYAELAPLPTSPGGGGTAGLGFDGETGRYENLDAVYCMRRTNASIGRAKIYDVRDYWTADGLKQESGFYSNAIYSKRGLKYPKVSVTATLPDLSDFYKANLWFAGLENGGGAAHGLASFRLDAANNVKVNAKAQNLNPGACVVTDLLPSDYLTSSHQYWVKINKGFTEFRVDGELVAVIVYGEIEQELYSGEPYCVRITPCDLPSRMATMVELTVEDPEGTYPEYTVEDLVPDNYRWNQGSPTPSRTFRLHDEGADTLMTSGTYAAGAVHYSHPVPIKGYGEKTVAFRADTATATGSPLVTEVYTQDLNWRAIDSYDLGANEFYYLDVNVDFPLLRVGYEPSADGASITDAEVNLA